MKTGKINTHTCMPGQLIIEPKCSRSRSLSLARSHSLTRSSLTHSFFFFQISFTHRYTMLNTKKEPHKFAQTYGRKRYFKGGRILLFLLQ